MKSATPKVLHSIAGRSLVGHALASAAAIEPQRVVVVVRHDRETVAEHITQIAPHVLLADQDEIPGTGRAAYCGLSALDATAVAAQVAAGAVGDTAVMETQAEGAVVVTSGDVPLVDGELLGALVDAHGAAGAAVTVLTATVDDPTGYGRIVRDAGTDEVLSIVEHKDATEEQRAITEINSGIYVFDAAVLRGALAQIGQDNAQGEMYLPDVIEIARREGGRTHAFIAPHAGDVEGVNDRVQLAQLGQELNARIVTRWMRDGVTVMDPATTWIDADVELAEDVTILPNTQLQGRTTVGTGTVVGPDTTLMDVTVGAGASVIRTHGSASVIDDGATVGPFSFLRPGTHLGASGRIGAFVETKNATIGEHTKVPHLSYVGDATIGHHTNVGAATIFVNYDGISKHHSTVGNHVRIGSDNSLIAPVEIGDGAYTGAGAVIRRDVPPGALGRNSSPQQVVEGWVGNRRPGSASALAAEEALRTHDDGLSEGARAERAAATEKTEGES